MNRIAELFETKDRNLLSVYFTAGFPSLDSTGEIIRALEAEGVDMIEIGVPFSDPMADGAVIQQSSARALENGMTLALLLEQIGKVRPECRIPLVLMGYLNPMMQYGIERLFEKCRSAGIDALIIPDLPFDEYMNGYKALCEQYDIPVIMLVTPETSADRIRLIDENCGGFIYVVSSASTTGVREHFTPEQLTYFRTIDGMGLKNRRLIGFGISNPETFSTVCRHGSGGIVGSLFIKCLSEADTLPDAAKKLAKAIRGC